MPIGDLLDSISGGSGPPAAVPSKRKPDDDLRSASKAPKRTPPPTRPNQPPARPSAAQTSSNMRGSNGKPAGSGLSNGAKTYMGTSSSANIGSRPAPKPSNVATRPPVTAASAKEAAPDSTAPPKNPPKKGSFAEIMARAKEAQNNMGKVGVLQHKKVEKGPPPKRGEPPTRGERTTGRPDPRAQGAGRTGYAGSSRPLQRNEGPAGASGGRAGNGAASKAKPQKPAKLTAEEKAKLAAEQRREERAKKHAAATTGYTGTSRPNTKPPVKKDEAPRGGALLNRAPPRPSTSRHSRFDDYYDDEMDDFIDDDEGESEAMPAFGKRYSYYDDESDGSSDMEAGIDDIDGEERRAERIARQEDIEEERLEKSLKQKKEDRKRQALEAIRARRG